MAIIVAQDLSKKFRELLAVDKISLEIEAGECFGLLGPNGAGKTSLIRMITAVSPPLSGDGWVQGMDINKHARKVKAGLGVVPQIDNLDEDLTVLQNMTTFARYFAIPKKEAETRSLKLLKLFKLEAKTNSRIRELSGGMKRLLLIARGLVNRPSVLILDEPTIGLDPQTKHLVWQQLRELRTQGITQLLCTQNMEEAATLCDRVAVMHLGRILSIDTPRALIAKHVGDKVLEIEVDSGNREEITREIINRGLDYIDIGNTVQVFHSDKDELAKRVIDFSRGLRQRQANLEDVFFRLTGRTLEE